MVTDTAEVSCRDLSWVLPELAMGGRLRVDEAEYLAKQLGIRRVVDLRVDDKDDETALRRHGIELLHLEELAAIAYRHLITGSASS